MCSLKTITFTCVLTIMLLSGACGVQTDSASEGSAEFALYAGTDYDYKYPWVIEIKTLPDLKYKCEGVLVAPRYVVTSYSCIGLGGPSLRFEAKRSSPIGYLYDYQDLAPTGDSSVNGDIVLWTLPRAFDLPGEYLSPAALPDVQGVVGQSGTVASYRNLTQFGVWNSTIISAYNDQFRNTDVFTADLCGASSRQGAGFVIPEGGWNVALGLVWSSSSCSNAEFVQLQQYSYWINQHTQYWGTFNRLSNATNARALSGDFNGDGLADIALVGGSGWTTVPVAFSLGNGTFSVTNATVANFPYWASGTGVKVAAGDVNGDGRDDLIAAGGSGWYTIPVAFSNGDGTFNVTNLANGSIPGWASGTGVKFLAGDVNNDGRDDIILTGGAGWYTIPVGFSNGDGTFNVTNYAASIIPTLAQDASAQASVTDVTGDGRADIVLTSGSGWTTVPMAISLGDGRFSVYNQANGNLSSWSQASGVKMLTGCRRTVAHPSLPNAHRCDVDANGRGDIILTGHSTWSTIPVGFSNGNGTLNVTNATVPNFPYWASDAGAKAVSGDFDGDRRADVALIGGSGWWTVPMAFSAGNGSFTVTNRRVY